MTPSHNLPMMRTKDLGSLQLMRLMRGSCRSRTKRRSRERRSLLVSAKERLEEKMKMMLETSLQILKSKLFHKRRLEKIVMMSQWTVKTWLKLVH